MGMQLRFMIFLSKHGLSRSLTSKSHSIKVYEVEYIVNIYVMKVGYN
mgnify:CR=1 FL=1